ncbi:hypothetical protein AB4160_16875 [Shewanella sp. 10N.286.51.B8]|uniref:hypothetical protein n=1 Tax=Shewanella sp. 10N.286.51.B8 TaxID=3229708 RepID=UPI00354DF937
MQETIYRDLLNNLEKSNYRNRLQSLCCFSAQKGELYNNNVMIVGRAVNEWDDDFQLNDMDTNLLVNKLFSKPFIPMCPLEWVESSWGSTEGYNTNKSAFWRVIRKLSESINKLSSDERWASKLVWSNLYKIAPSAGGNPSDSLCGYQFDACNELLKVEIQEYKPKCIVFFTGENWFDGFLLENITLMNKSESKLVDARGILKLNGFTTKIVIAKHPQGKPEANMLNEILDALA